MYAVAMAIRHRQAKRGWLIKRRSKSRIKWVPLKKYLSSCIAKKRWRKSEKKKIRQIKKFKISCINYLDYQHQKTVIIENSKLVCILDVLAKFLAVLLKDRRFTPVAIVMLLPLNILV